MDPFKQSSSFSYCSSTGANILNTQFSGVLEVQVHHARNIHNICIYDNQDVYAKFSLTYNPDETVSTRVVNGGGKNPDFNEILFINVNQIDAVLKCEIWMLSRARHYLEDQLLGFALVPISEIIGRSKVTHDYSLSSTDLFHSPAGTIKLTLFLDTSVVNLSKESSSNPSISSEVVLLGPQVVEIEPDPVEYARIEFPDNNVAAENQKMVAEYFSGLHLRPNHEEVGSLLHLGAAYHDLEMTGNPLEEYPEPSHHESVSPSGSFQNSELLNSTTTSLSDDRNSVDLLNSGHETNHSLSAGPGTPTSKKGIEGGDGKDIMNFSRMDEKKNTEGNKRVFKGPVGDSHMEAEQSVMQKQIVDMYMKSMQQFTESLAKMKIPMDLDKLQHKAHPKDVIQNHEDTKLETEKKKKEGSRVFYGSRAFF